MRLFLYLEKEEYKDTWINGGIAPLKLASPAVVPRRYQQIKENWTTRTYY